MQLFFSGFLKKFWPGRKGAFAGRKMKGPARRVRRAAGQKARGRKGRGAAGGGWQMAAAAYVANFHRLLDRPFCAANKVQKHARGLAARRKNSFFRKGEDVSFKAEFYIIFVRFAAEFCLLQGFPLYSARE